LNKTKLHTPKYIKQAVTMTSFPNGQMGWEGKEVEVE
jgi:hypothetical protein